MSISERLKSIASGKNICKAVFIAVAGFFFIFFYFYPNAIDDYWFLRCIRFHATLAGHSDNLWYGLYGAGVEHYLQDNARLANTVYIFILLLPHVVPAIISTIAFAAAYWLSLELASANSLLWFSTVTLMTCVFLPWHDNMFVVMYSMNYVWTAPLMLACVYIFISKDNFNKWAGLGLGIFTGLSHEGFAVPIIFSMVVMLVFKLIPANKHRLFLLAGLVIGLLWLCISPSIPIRLDEFLNSSERLSVIKTEWAFYLYLIVWTVCFCSRKWRKIATHRIAIFCLLTGFAVIPIHLFCHRMRATYPMVLVSIIGTVYLLKNCIGNCNRKSIIHSISALILVITFSHLTIASLRIIDLNKEIGVMNEEISKATAENSTIYSPLHYDHQEPWGVLGKSNFMSACILTTSQAKYLCPTTKITILPAELQNYSGQYDSVIPGNAHALFYNELFILPLKDGQDDIDYSALQIKFSGSWHTFQKIKFTGADGKNYLLLIPFAKISDFSRKIQEINVL